MNTNAAPRAFALTIAGSDSGGGAGIQADLRAFASQGVFGLCAITAITAQNSGAVTRVQTLSTAMVRAQMEAVFSDYAVNAVKTGMLSNAAITRIAAHAASKSTLPWVVDPVMIASSGARLLDPNAERALREQLLPCAAVLTPNIPEAAVLLGNNITRASQMEAAAERLRALGPRAVLLKGGHLSGKEVIDVYADGDGLVIFRTPRRRLNGHGTGCTLASLLTARLALGATGRDAADQAISAFRTALMGGAEVGGSRVWTPYPVGAPLARA